MGYNGKLLKQIMDNLDKPGRDRTPKNKQKKPIVSSRGQWDHPGQRTIVPTPDGRITMMGVPYPVYGQDETGYGQMMYPGQEYQFPGQMVDEHPMMQNGGWLPKFLERAQLGISTSESTALPRNLDPRIRAAIEEDMKRTNQRVIKNTKPFSEEVEYKNLPEIVVKGINKKKKAVLDNTSKSTALPRNFDSRIKASSDNTRTQKYIPLLSEEASNTKLISDIYEIAAEFDKEKKLNRIKNTALRTADVTTDLMQLGNFVPHPLPQLIGKIGNIAGATIDGYQAAEAFNKGDYLETGINLASVGLPMMLGANTFRRNSKYLKPGQPLYPFSPQARIFPGGYTRVNYIEPFTKVRGMTNKNLLANRALLSTLGAETVYDVKKQGGQYAGNLPKAQVGTMVTPLDFSKPLGTLQGASDVMSAPARTATYLLTGKYQDPSQALGINNPWGAFAADMLLDPMNLVGAGVASKVAGAAVRSAANKVAPIVSKTVMPVINNKIRPFVDQKIAPALDNISDMMYQVNPFATINTDINRLNSKNAARLVDFKTDLSGGRGQFNYGVYPFKRNPNYLLKLDNVRGAGATFGTGDQIYSDLPDMMKNVNSQNFARIFRDIDLTGGNLPVNRSGYGFSRKTPVAGRVMNKMTGKNIADLTYEDLKNIPAEAYQQLMNDTRLLNQNKLVVDFVGDNIMYDQGKKKFNLLDLSKNDFDSNAEWIFAHESGKLNTNRVKEMMKQKMMSAFYNNNYQAPNGYDSRWLNALQSRISDRINNIKKKGGQHSGHQQYQNGGQSAPSSYDSWFKYNTREGKRGVKSDNSYLDYDYRKYHDDMKKGLVSYVDPMSDEHYPDTYKLPNHPTFSVESMHYMGDPRRQPNVMSWNGDFTPTYKTKGNFIPTIYNQGGENDEEPKTVLGRKVVGKLSTPISQVNLRPVYKNFRAKREPVYDPNCPDGVGCSRQATKVAQQITGLPYPSYAPADATFRDAVAENYGLKNIFDQEGAQRRNANSNLSTWKYPKPDDFDKWKAGDIVSLDAGLDVFNYSPPPGYTWKDASHVSHNGTIIGFTETGRPIIKHGYAKERNQGESLTEVLGNDNRVSSLGHGRYAVKSVWRPKEVDDDGKINKVSYVTEEGTDIAGRKQATSSNQSFYLKNTEEENMMREAAGAAEFSGASNRLQTKQSLVKMFNDEKLNKELQYKLGMTAQELDALKPVVYGVFGQESRFNDIDNVGASFKELIGNVVGAGSRGPAQIKFSSLTKNERKVLGIKKPKDLEKDDVAYKAAMLLLNNSRKRMNLEVEQGTHPELVDKDENFRAGYYYNSPGRAVSTVKEWGDKNKPTSILNPFTWTNTLSTRRRPGIFASKIPNYDQQNQLRMDEGSYPSKLMQNAQDLGVEVDFEKGQDLEELVIHASRPGSKFQKFNEGGEMIRRADGSYSQRGLWDNIRANKGSGKKPTKEMLKQERNIKAKEMKNGGTNNPGFYALPEYVQANILANMGYGGYYNPMLADGGEPNGEMALGQMAAVQDKMNKLRQFVGPDQNLDPWVASKLAVMDHSADAIADYMMYGQQGEEEMMQQPQGIPMAEMRDGGGIPERYRNMGFTKPGVKKQSTRPGKKWMVLAKKGSQYKVVHGGHDGMKDFSQHGSDKRKENFWNRMGGKNSSKATDPFSPLYWHKKFGTWQEGGEIEEMANGGYIGHDGMRHMSNTPTWSGNVGYQTGGPVSGQEIDVTPEQLEMLRAQGYQFEMI